MTQPKLAIRETTVRFIISALFLMALFASLAGCMRVNEQSEGDKKKVDISTPFGDVKVRTDAEAKDIGLPVYPGATPKPKDEHNSNNANVNLSFGEFGLKVVALTYQTNDAPDKVLAFYRNELKKYGNTLECKGGSSIGHVQLHAGSKDGDSKELKCDGNDSGDSTELKVGTEDHQRVVGVKPNGSGSEFSLVFVHTRGKEGSL